MRRLKGALPRTKRGIGVIYSEITRHSCLSIANIPGIYRVQPRGYRRVDNITLIWFNIVYSSLE